MVHRKGPYEILKLYFWVTLTKVKFKPFKDYYEVRKKIVPSVPKKIKKSLLRKISITFERVNISTGSGSRTDTEYLAVPAPFLEQPYTFCRFQVRFYKTFAHGSSS